MMIRLAHTEVALRHAYNKSFTETRFPIAIHVKTIASHGLDTLLPATTCHECKRFVCHVRCSDGNSVHVQLQVARTEVFSSNPVLAYDSRDLALFCSFVLINLRSWSEWECCTKGGEAGPSHEMCALTTEHTS
jgi:hypothetical protein